MITYILQPNTLAAPGGVAATGFHAQVVQTEERTTADFVRTMAELKGGATEGEAAQWLDVVRRAFISEISRGCNVNIKGFFNARATIKGPFPASDSFFDPARNVLRVAMNVSKTIIKAIKDCATSHVSEANSGLFIGHIQDAASGTEDSILTPGMVCKVHGSKIKLAGDDPSVGVYFIDAHGEASRVARTAVSWNGIKEIDLVVPPLPAGAYTVRVTTMYSGGRNLLSSPRSYTCPAPLTVGSAP